MLHRHRSPGNRHGANCNARKQCLTGIAPAAAVASKCQTRDRWFTGIVTIAAANRRSPRTKIGRQAEATRRAIGQQIVQLRLDANISQRQLAIAAGIPQAFLSRSEAGTVEPSIAVLIAIGEALGADLTVRFHPGTGPRIRDRIQAPIVEELVRISRPAWRSMPEVAVWRPARGVIDLVLARPHQVVVACEVHTEIRRLEQMLRWASSKADALPSARDWSMFSGGAPETLISRLLVLRSTPATRELTREFEATLRAAYPARTADALGALSDAATPWPGSAVLWATTSQATARLLPGPPRGVGLGR
jgi:transcriptional regulator with XRE-family HTH domain